MRACKSVTALVGLAAAAEAIHMRKKKYYLQQRAGDKTKCEAAIKAVATSGTVAKPAGAAGTPVVLDTAHADVITDDMLKDNKDNAKGNLTKDTKLCRDVASDCDGLTDLLANDIEFKAADGTASLSPTLTAAATLGLPMKDFLSKFKTCSADWAPADAKQKDCLALIKNGDKALEKEQCEKFKKDDGKFELKKGCPDGGDSEVSTYIGLLAATKQVAINLKALSDADTVDTSCAKIAGAAGEKGSSGSR